LYRVHEFAELAGVTVKALHHYDRLGLLKPKRAGSGYRLYAEQDLARLEQIVALKFLGLPLRRIKVLLDREPFRLPEALRAQRAVLEEKRRLLDRAIAAIAKAENAPADAAVLKEIIEAIGMQTEPQDATDFMKNYYREDAWAGFRARHREWRSKEWAELFRDVQAAFGEDPGSARAQRLAARWRTLRARDADGDPKVYMGLLKAWNDREYWPEEVQGRYAEFDLRQISAFMKSAFAAYRTRRFGDFAWTAELASFTAKEKEQRLLATVDLNLRIGNALQEDPEGEAGQALAARWMELVESCTGAPPPDPGWQEAQVKWMATWPPRVLERARALDQGKILAFIVEAFRHPMEIQVERPG